MAKKEFTYRGKTLEEIKNMDSKQFMELLPSRQRRTLKRGFTHPQKRLLEKVKKNKRNLKTHCRDLILTPEVLDKTLVLYNGKEWMPVKVTPEMLGHYLGEFVMTRKKVSHNAPGIGATRSSASVSVK